MLRFAGYINDPVYLAFVIGRIDQFIEEGEANVEPITQQSHTLEIIIDIFMTLDIIRCFLTAPMDDMKA